METFLRPLARLQRLALRDLDHLEGAVGVGQAELRVDHVVAAAGAGDRGRDLEERAVDRRDDPARREVPVELDHGDDPDADRVGIGIVAILDDVQLAALDQQAVGIDQLAVAASDLDAIGEAREGVDLEQLARIALDDDQRLAAASSLDAVGVEPDTVGVIAAERDALQVTELAPLAERDEVQPRVVRVCEVRTALGDDHVVDEARVVAGEVVAQLGAGASVIDADVLGVGPGDEQAAEPVDLEPGGGAVVTRDVRATLDEDVALARAQAAAI